jgi:hypothetical protein
MRTAESPGYASRRQGSGGWCSRWLPECRPLPPLHPGYVTFMTFPPFVDDSGAILIAYNSHYRPPSGHHH